MLRAAVQGYELDSRSYYVLPRDSYRAQLPYLTHFFFIQVEYNMFAKIAYQLQGIFIEILPQRTLVEHSQPAWLCKHHSWSRHRAAWEWSPGRPYSGHR